MRRRTLLALIAAMPLPLPAFANVRRDGLIEPELRIAPGEGPSPRVALTLDACMGAVDHRILDTLIDNKIPVTIFVTGRWLARNGEAVKALLAHPDLFQLENHGAMHLPAVTGMEKVYGLSPAGTLAAIAAEVDGGAAAMTALGIPSPRWYRDATALYSGDALLRIRQMGYRIAGFSLNADFGASLPADRVTERMLMARDGDVIIAHINQPKRASGAGVAAGILALKAKGFTFVRLEDARVMHAWGEGRVASGAAVPSTRARTPGAFQ